jgi:transposase
MYSFETVFKALDLYNQYKSYNKTALLLNLYRQTVTNWIKKYKDNLMQLNDRIISNIKKNFNLDIKFDFNDDNIINFIKNTIKINPFLTKKEMRIKIINKFNIKISNKKLSLIYKKIKLTRKKVKKRVCKDEKFIDILSEERRKFINKINTIDKDKIISIDETGINNVLNNLFGYAEKGIDINLPINNKKNTNNSIIIALTINGIIHYEIYQESINVKSFYDFIVNVLNKLKEKNYVFLFDNIRFHKNKEILNLITSNGHKYIFTPGYSPDLNPIENVNGIIKQTIDKLILNDTLDNNVLKNNEKIDIHIKIKEKRNEKNIKLNEEKIKIKNENKKKMKQISKDKKINKKIKKEIKKENKNKMLNEIKIIKNELTEKMRKEINLLKNIKIINYINKAIMQFNLKYSKHQIIKIYDHAFKFDYTLIKKELKDRIIFSKVI